MATLAGVYLRLDPFETLLGLDELHGIFRDIARPVAREIYGRGVDLEVWVQLGSLRGRVWVVAAVIYPMIAQYPDFRSGLGLLVEDAHRFASRTSEFVVKALHADPVQIKRIERRTGVPGQLRRLVEELDHQSPPIPESVWERMPFLDEATRRGKRLSDLLEPPGGIEPKH